MGLTIRVSKKHQVVIPREARRLLKIKQGSELLVNVKEDRIVLIPKPVDYVAHMAGLHKEVWEGIDATEYVKKERRAWED
jgi:AbrB family looped-hinge helix DNA binding protein